MITPRGDTPQYVNTSGDRNAPAYSQNPGLIMSMSDQQFRIPFHNESHRPSLRPQIPPNRYHPYFCIKFQRGNCNYGDNCRFAHFVGDQHLPRFENPSGNSMSKTRLCWNYSNGGQCPHGERCHFIHDNTRKSFAIRVLNRGGGGGDFKSEVEGGLNAANQVYQRRVAMKKRLCRKWETNGRCPYGHNCIFAHGESELMKSENDKASAHVTTTPKKQQVFKWTDIEKISRIYADWIGNTPLVHD